MDIIYIHNTSTDGMACMTCCDCESVTQTPWGQLCCSYLVLLEFGWSMLLIDSWGIIQMVSQ